VARKGVLLVSMTATLPRLQLNVEYCRYLFGKEFNDMKDDERRHLTADFDRLRPKVYQEALKGEVNSNLFTSRIKQISSFIGHQVELQGL